MSGYKRATVNISQDEYNRLRDADRKLRTLPEPENASFEAILQKSNQALRSNLETMQQRQVFFERLVSSMDENIRELESSTSQAMLAYEQKAITEAQNYAGCLWDHFNHVIQEHAAYFENTINANHARYQQELAQQSRRIRRIAQDQEQKQMLATQWLDAAEQLCTFIKEQYAYQAFSPGSMEHLERQLNQARDNLAVGLSEAVILNSQQLYTAFSDLRVDLERWQNEWSMLLEAAIEACSQIIVLAENSQVVSAVDLDGNPLSFSIDVDYWAQGRLTLLRTDLGWILEQLQSEDNLPDSETLERWLNIDLPGYYQALEEIVMDARVDALNSQLRINIADLVVRALQEQGFALVGSEYEAADQRSSFGARMTNLEGNEVVVQVAPTGRDLGANELHLQSIDREERTEHELQQRWYEVSRSLASFGLEVGQYVREDQPVYQSSPAQAQPAARRPGRMQQGRKSHGSG